jgi:hypothetical protein
MFYRMGLAQANKQLRKEYLPVYIQKTTVAVCCTELADFLEAFYPPHASALPGPWNLTVCISHKHRPCASLFDILPLLRIRLAHPQFRCRFFTAEGCVFGRPPWSLTRNLEALCSMLETFCKLDDPVWAALLRSGRITRVDVSFLVQTSIPDVELEIAPGEAVEDMERIKGVFKKVPYTFSMLRWRGSPSGGMSSFKQEMLWDEDDDFYW